MLGLAETTLLLKKSGEVQYPEIMYNCTTAVAQKARKKDVCCAQACPEMDKCSVISMQIVHKSMCTKKQNISNTLICQ